MTNILAIFTCYNRRDYTKQAIEKLIAGNKDCAFHFVVADDASTDGTGKMLLNLSEEYDLTIISGDGSLFYSGGMRCAMKKAREFGSLNYDYILLMNDDVNFLENAIEKIVAQSISQSDAVVVGVCSDDSGKLSYGAIKYTRGIKYEFLGIEDWQQCADTFNANCVLIPSFIFEKVPIMDRHYVHSLGDFDYGLSIKKAGYEIHPSKEYVGVCNDNPQINTWKDSSLPIIERIKRKESPKGDPSKQWFYFLKKNFGLGIAIIKTVTPYIRILLGK